MRNAFLLRVIEIRNAEQLAQRMSLREHDRDDPRPMCIGGCGSRTSSPDHLCSVCSKRNTEAKVDRARELRRMGRSG